MKPSRRDILAGLCAAAGVAAFGPLEALAFAAAPEARRRSDAITFGYASITWNGNDLQAIEDISALGFTGIQLRSNILPEFGAKPAALRDILTQHGLTLVALSSGNVTIDPSKEAEDLATHAKNAQFVKDVGGLYLQVTDARPKGREMVAAD
jgi:inosose dehydratase